jgi:hypothetical protein
MLTQSKRLAAVHHGYPVEFVGFIACVIAERGGCLGPIWDRVTLWA